MKKSFQILAYSKKDGFEKNPHFESSKVPHMDALKGASLDASFEVAVWAKIRTGEMAPSGND